MRLGFEQQIRSWQRRKQVTVMLGDVYDGQMWKEVKDIAGRSFVEDWRSVPADPKRGLV